MSVLYSQTAEFQPARSTDVKIARYALAALLIMVLFGLAPLSAGTKDAAISGEGGGVRQLIYLAIFGGFIIASGGLRNLRELNAIPISVLLVIAWCWLSVLWAIDPMISVRRVLLTTIVMWIVFKAVRAAGYQDTLQILRSILLLTLVLNFISIAVMPNAVHQFAEAGGDQNLVGSWRGLLQQKNFAGAVCAITICLYLFDAGHIRRVVRLLVILGSAYFLYRTQSKTSMGLLALSIGGGAAFHLYNPRYRLLALPIFVMTALTIVVLSELFSEWVASFFAADDALTGRIQIWPVLMNYIHDNFWLGAGFGSFWNIGASSPIFQYVSSKSWISSIVSGHNGYLDLMTQVGFPGLFLAFVAFVLIPFGNLFAATSQNRGAGGLLFSLLLFVLLHNFTESSIMDRDMIVHVFLVTIVALIGTYKSGSAATDDEMVEIDLPDDLTLAAITGRR
jgi:O-antigen ligase